MEFNDQDFIKLSNLVDNLREVVAKLDRNIAGLSVVVHNLSVSKED